MTRLRVAYLPASLNPGGAERQMLTLAERLPRDRFEVEFITLSGAGLYDDRARAAGLRVSHAGAPPAPNAELPARVWHRATKTLRYARLIRSGHYDIVDAWLYPADVLAALLRPFTGTPIIVAGRRNVDPQHYFGPLERVVKPIVGRLTDAVVANSAAAGEHAVEAGIVRRAKLRVIRNGVVVPTSASADERLASRAALGVDDPDLVTIGSVANFLPVKRHDLMVDVYGALVSDGLPVRLVLIGDGPLRPAIETQIERLGLGGHVRVHGSIHQPEALLAGLDVVVQASDREGLPNALLEAGAAGRPMVATAAGGSGEIVVDGSTGFLVPVGDGPALGAALRRLVIDRALRERMGAAARAHVAATFGMDRFVREFAELYESLAAQRRARWP